MEFFPHFSSRTPPQHIVKEEPQNTAPPRQKTPSFVRQGCAVSLRDEVVCVCVKIDEMKRRTDEMKRSVHGCVRVRKKFFAVKSFCCKKFFPLKMLAQCMRACALCDPKKFFLTFFKKGIDKRF